MKPAALFGLLAALAMPAFADPGYYVVTPYDREGIASAELRYWTVKPDDDIETTWPEVAFSYGVNSRWTTLLLASYIGSTSEATKPSLLTWQNVVLLTQGELPVDIALYGAVSRLLGSRPGHSYEYGPVLQTEFGRTQVNLNALFERVRRSGSWGPLRLKYQWQLRQHSRSWLQPGLQGFGELGDWDHWSGHSQQSNRAGPAVFATLPPGGQHALQVQAAYLAGRTYGDSGRMFSLRVLLPF